MAELHGEVRALKAARSLEHHEHDLRLGRLAQDNAAIWQELLDLLQDQVRQVCSSMQVFQEHYNIKVFVLAGELINTHILLARCSYHKRGHLPTQMQLPCWNSLAQPRAATFSSVRGRWAIYEQPNAEKYTMASMLHAIACNHCVTLQIHIGSS